MDDIFDITPYPTQYRTQKHVIISSRWIKVPHFVLSLIALIFLVWSICWNLSFMEAGGVLLNTAIRLKYPMTNYESCTDTDMDCEFHTLNSSLEYCRERATAAGIIEWEINNTHEVLERHVLGCRDVDIHDDDLAGDKLLIPTMITRFFQRRCAGDECRLAHVHRGWITERIEGHFVTDIESFTVSIAHTYQVDRLSMRGTGTTEQGFLDDHGGNRCIIACTSDCGYPHFRRWGANYPPCGSNTQHSGNASYSSHRGDVFSVGRLLKAAGIELDSARPEFGNLSARVTGLALTLDIIYDNLESFWQLPWGPKIKYVYRPYESSFGVREELYKTFVHHPSDAQSRVLERYTGIVLRVHTDGAMSQFSLVHFIYAIASFLALLKCADVIVERFLVPAYGLFPCTAHIPQFFKIHKAERSIAEDRFMERQGRLAEISLDADDDALRSGFEQAYLKRDATEILECLQDTLLVPATDSE
mmetsp:Transcript_62117/g.175156  ORF Transcript_62117/g.175156 Transcript_62117/m.175156 type:complete len:474 (+) Transcript_62117:150-1571(+)